MMQATAVRARTLGAPIGIKGQGIRQNGNCLRRLTLRDLPDSRISRCFFSNLPQRRACSCRICKGTNSADSLATTSSACASSLRARTQSLTPPSTSCLPSKRCRTFTSATSFLFQHSTPHHKQLSTEPATMSLKKELVSQGDGKTYPKAGDTVTMEYTGQ